MMPISIENTVLSTRMATGERTWPVCGSMYSISFEVADSSRRASATLVTVQHYVLEAAHDEKTKSRCRAEPAVAPRPFFRLTRARLPLLSRLLCRSSLGISTQGRDQGAAVLQVRLRRARASRSGRWTEARDLELRAGVE